jgi:hypothetical protein
MNTIPAAVRSSAISRPRLPRLPWSRLLWPVRRRVRRGSPGLVGMLERAGGDVDEDLCAGQLGDRVLQLGGVVKQARAGVLL